LSIAKLEDDTDILKHNREDLLWDPNGIGIADLSGSTKAHNLLIGKLRGTIKRQKKVDVLMMFIRREEKS
jgi:hypothetical protein